MSKMRDGWRLIDTYRGAGNKPTQVWLRGNNLSLFGKHSGVFPGVVYGKSYALSPHFDTGAWERIREILKKDPWFRLAMRVRAYREKKCQS